jgi:uncharacterized protein (TIGR00369 family)
VTDLPTDLPADDPTEDPTDDVSAAAIERLFGANPFLTLLGIELVQRSADRVVLRLPWRPELRNVVGNHHGGVIASLADVVAAAAIWNAHTFVPGARLMTLSMSLQYVGSAPEEELVAEGWSPRRGRAVAFAEMSIGTASGAAIATAHATYGIREPETQQRRRA